MHLGSDERHTFVRRQTVAILVAVVALFVPVWHVTTQVHRAVVPVAAIRALQAAASWPSSFNVSVNIVAHGPVAATQLDSVAATTQALLNQLLNDDQNEVHAKNTAAFAFQVDAGPRRSAAEPSTNGKYTLVLDCGSKSLQGEGALRIYDDRIVYLQTQTPCEDSNTLSDLVVTVLGGLFLDEKQDLDRVLSGQNKDDIRKVKFSSEYQLTFSLMNADPVSFLADWDIKAAIEDHFQHFVDAVRKLYDFKISSQIKYFTSLPIQPDFTRDGYFLRPHHLPHFINSAEWSFGGSVVSTSPPLNFVLYVPPAAQSPLQITDAAHARLDTNAFLIPQWGGIVIHNPNRTTSSTTRAGVPRQTLTSTHLRNTMQIFISQLRELLGVKDVTLGRAEKLLPGFTFQYDRSPAGITKWSLDRLTRLTILQNTQRASETLVSLLNLIESMPDMVVQDHIAQKIAHALRAIEVARSPAGAHDVRLAAAGVAVKVAEEAFFDPTMVSLLYFPSEHKLAVYMPLFLPVGVPLLQTLVQEFKKIVAKRRAGKVKTE